jgi:hypothetical protein
MIFTPPVVQVVWVTSGLVLIRFHSVPTSRCSNLFECDRRILNFRLMLRDREYRIWLLFLSCLDKQNLRRFFCNPMSMRTVGGLPCRKFGSEVPNAYVVCKQRRHFHSTVFLHSTVLHPRHHADLAPWRGPVKTFFWEGVCTDYPLLKCPYISEVISSFPLLRFSDMTLTR